MILKVYSRAAAQVCTVFKPAQRDVAIVANETSDFPCYVTVIHGQPPVFLARSFADSAHAPLLQKQGFIHVDRDTELQPKMLVQDHPLPARRLEKTALRRFVSGLHLGSIKIGASTRSRPRLFLPRTSTGTVTLPVIGDPLSRVSVVTRLAQGAVIIVLCAAGNKLVNRLHDLAVNAVFPHLLSTPRTCFALVEKTVRRFTADRELRSIFDRFTKYAPLLADFRLKLFEYSTRYRLAGLTLRGYSVLAVRSLIKLGQTFRRATNSTDFLVYNRFSHVANAPFVSELVRPV